MDLYGVHKNQVVMEIELFKWMDFKLPKVIFRKLGKHRVYGYFFKNKIHIDSSLKGKECCEIEIHEFYHWLYPEHSEEQVRKDSRKLTEYLWALGYRKVDNKE